MSKRLRPVSQYPIARIDNEVRPDALYTGSAVIDLHRRFQVEIQINELSRLVDRACDAVIITNNNKEIRAFLLAFAFHDHIVGRASALITKIFGNNPIPVDAAQDIKRTKELADLIEAITECAEENPELPARVKAMREWIDKHKSQEIASILDYRKYVDVGGRPSNSDDPTSDAIWRCGQDLARQHRDKSNYIAQTTTDLYHRIARKPEAERSEDERLIFADFKDKNTKQRKDKVKHVFAYRGDIWGTSVE